jgi:hypothetical protein
VAQEKELNHNGSSVIAGPEQVQLRRLRRLILELLLPPREKHPALEQVQAQAQAQE